MTPDTIANRIIREIRHQLEERPPTQCLELRMVAPGCSNLCVSDLLDLCKMAELRANDPDGWLRRAATGLPLFDGKE